VDRRENTLMICTTINIAGISKELGRNEQISGLLDFWSFSVVRYFKETGHFGNWICFQPQGKGWRTRTTLCGKKDLILVT
jgi:hypothetical protein